MAGKGTAGRAARSAVERAGRGRNPVARKKPTAGDSRQRSGRVPRPPVGERSPRRKGTPAAVHRAAQRTPLTVRGVGLLAGGLLLGVGAGVTLERALVGRDRRREDPEAEEAFGGIRGAPAKLTSHDGTRLYVEELGQGPCLVFAHGFSLTQDAWHYQRRDLPERYRCVFYDQRGHGRSGRPRGNDYSL